MRTRIRVTSGLLVAAALLFGGVQAARASSVLRQPDCPESGNWCAISRGGDFNCNQCCGTPEGGSLCAFYTEDPTSPPFPQGCICA